jgi:hypothetical protein
VYKIVENKSEQKVFDDIWRMAREEKQFDDDSPCEQAYSYLIYAGHKLESTPIGTLEFLAYDPRRGDTEHYFAFSEDRRVKGRVFEIDKCSLLPEYRRQNHLDSLVTVVDEFAKKEQVETYIALMDSLFYRILLWQYKAELIKLGELIQKGKQRLIPIAIDVKRNREIIKILKKEEN